MKKLNEKCVSLFISLLTSALSSNSRIRRRMKKTGYVGKKKKNSDHHELSGAEKREEKYTGRNQVSLDEVRAVNRTPIWIRAGRWMIDAMHAALDARCLFD